MKTLLNIIAGLLLLFQSWSNKKEQQRAQAEADKVSNDPVDWFSNHFGVRKQQDAEAGKTNTHDSDRV